MNPPVDSVPKSLAKTKHKVSATASGSARGLRVTAMNEARKAHVLAAAREAFIEKGLDGASMREIARRAGYTPGAIYSYFASKEELYGALLDESLRRLGAGVATAETAAGRGAAARLRASAYAFFDFYRENPRDLDLGFYLFQGMRPRGLTPKLNKALNISLHEALAPSQEALLSMGMSQVCAQAEITALFAHMVGLLLLSHTGRIRMFNQSPESLFAVYLDGLLRRGEAAAANDAYGTSEQVER